MTLKLYEVTSKHKAIKRKLLKGESITGWQAMRSFNVYRLSSIINRLRNEGLNIKTNMGGGYATYFIPKVNGIVMSYIVIA